MVTGIQEIYQIMLGKKTRRIEGSKECNGSRGGHRNKLYQDYYENLFLISDDVIDNIFYYLRILSIRQLLDSKNWFINVFSIVFYLYRPQNHLPLTVRRNLFKNPLSIKHTHTLKC